MGGKGRHVDDAGRQEPPPLPEGLGQRAPRRPSMRGGGPLLGVSGPPRKPSGMRSDRGAAQADSQGLRARAIGRAALGGREAGRGLGAGSDGRPRGSQLDQVVAEIERRALVRDAALVAAEERAVREESLREFDAIESAQRAAQAEQVPPPPLCAAVLAATEEAPLRPTRLAGAALPGLLPWKSRVESAGPFLRKTVAEECNASPLRLKSTRVCRARPNTSPGLKPVSRAHLGAPGVSGGTSCAGPAAVGVRGESRGRSGGPPP